MYYTPDEIDEAQAKLNLEKENFDNSLDEDHKKKVKAIGEAFKLFEEANLPVFLFAEHEVMNSNGEKVMVQYNNMREISLSREGNIEIVRLTKKFAESVLGFISSFIFGFLQKRGLLVPINLLPVAYFDLYDNLNTESLDSVRKSEEEFTERLRKRAEIIKN